MKAAPMDTKDESHVYVYPLVISTTNRTNVSGLSGLTALARGFVWEGGSIYERLTTEPE